MLEQPTQEEIDDSIITIINKIKYTLMEIELYEPKEHTVVFSKEILRLTEDMSKVKDMETIVSLLYLSSSINAKIGMLEAYKRLKEDKKVEEITEANKTTYRLLCKTLDGYRGVVYSKLSDAEAEMSIACCPNNEQMEEGIKDISELVYEYSPTKGNA